MTKAEKFIKDCTRNCSNTSKGYRSKGVYIPSYCVPWLTPDQARRAVEIANDEMVERACEYLDGFIELLNEHGHRLKKERIISGLKQAIKGD